MSLECHADSKISHESSAAKCGEMTGKHDGRGGFRYFTGNKRNKG
jgi:hypothetical protein